MATEHAVTVAYGDGIGPEIMQAALAVLEAADVPLKIDVVEVGLAVYSRGISAGIEASAWESVRRTGVFLKAPITTPQGGGMKSLNVTVRKALGLYANVRPCRSYAPFVETHHPFMDLVVIRENEEDLYAGIEHRQTRQVTQCLKLITRPGCERILRYAFDYTRARERKKLTCMTKANIMKVTDGLFRKVFDELSKEYSDIDTEHMIIDIGMARVADTPEHFDVIVLPNLYGDILSDVAAQISGSVGLCGSANIGDHGAMFEAIHGSAPDIAGKDIANPSGLIISAAKMLAYLGEDSKAELIHNAWLATIEDGVFTADMQARTTQSQRVGTKEFAAAVIERLGRQPETLHVAHYHGFRLQTAPREQPLETKTLVGVDVFVDWSEAEPNELGSKLSQLTGPEFELVMITNRGVKVWPEGFPETFCTDHWRCRFAAAKQGGEVSHREIIALLNRLEEGGLDFIKTEHLYEFDGIPGYSLGQGQ